MKLSGIKPLILFAFFISLFFNCDVSDTGTNTTDEPSNRSMQSLIKADSCASFENKLKENLIREMEARVDENLQIALDNSTDGCLMYEYMYFADMDADAVNSPVPESESAEDYSDTNVQVAGVDEADFVKNDGSYIYIVGDDSFEILDAWPPQEARVLTSVKIEGTAKKLFVYNNKALVYSSIGSSDARFYGYNPGECTYGYDCDFTGDGLMLKVTVFDITEKTAPVLLRETLFSGSYLNARRINSMVYTAVIFPEITIAGVQYWPNSVPRCPSWYYDTGDQTDVTLTPELISAEFEILKNKNRIIIQDADISDILPGVKDVRYVNEQTIVDEEIFEGCPDFYLSQSPDSRSILSLVSLELDELGPLSSTTIMAKPGALYGSKNSIYIAARQYRRNFNTWYFDDSRKINEASTVHKFRLLPDTVETEYAGSGVVKGRVLNQFSMDEREGYLRIATTSGHVPDPNVHSTITAIHEAENELVQAGVIDNIAPTEDIRSVRFNGTMVYVVTFKKTDPLFAFDFSDPENPFVQGELKIPGYSTYMHLMDKSHLLTIGYDAEDQGDFAYFQGIMLQIFDVSNPAELKLMHKEIIGTRGTTSDAATNHLAFNYFASRNLLALPMVICEDSQGDWDYGDIMTFSGLLVYRVTLDEGFDLRGGISHEESETPETCYGACNNWWTRSNSIVKRSIFMEDYAYSIALDTINIAHVDDLKTIITSITLD